MPMELKFNFLPEANKLSSDPALCWPPSSYKVTETETHGLLPTSFPGLVGKVSSYFVIKYGSLQRPFWDIVKYLRWRLFAKIAYG